MATEITTSFSELKNWLEVGYFTSQIIIMFLVGFGLRQLQLTKKQIETTKDIFKTQSKRAAVEASVVECRRFAETVIQDFVALHTYCETNSITYFEKVKLTKTDNVFTVNTSDINKEDIKKLSNSNDLINKYLNGLEAYALFFLSGVADENIAFHTNAKSYIEMCELAFKLFPICGLEDDDAEPIKTLYFLWSEKHEAMKLKVKQIEIGKKLSTYKEHNLKPIGT